MKQDIRINYSILEDIQLKTQKYKEALEIIEDVITNVHNSLVTNNKGKAIEATLNLDLELKSQISSCKKEVTDINKIFTEYTNQMESIIAAKDITINTRVDRDDIWWNMESIKNACTSITTGGGIRKIQMMEYQSYDRYSGKPLSNSYTSSSETLSEEEIAKQKENYRKWMEIQGIVDKYQVALRENIDAMNNLFNTKIVAFEDADDEFSKKADTLYNEYTDFWERTGDIVLDIVVGAKNIVLGVLKGAFDLVVGIITCVVGLAFMPIVYAMSDLAGVVNELTGGDAPDWLNWFTTKREEYDTIVQTIINDPFIIVESLAQESQDMWEEKGLCFFGGYVIGDMIDTLLGSKGAGKLADALKVSKVDNILDPKLLKLVAVSFDSTDDFFNYLRKNVWKDPTLTNAEKIAITKANFYKLIPEQMKNLNMIGDERFLIEASEKTDWGDWPPIKWPDFPGLDKTKEVVAISRKTPMPTEIDRIGSLNGNNFGMIPNGRPPYTQAERAICYIDNINAYNKYMVDNTYYFDVIDCIKNNDLDGINKLVDELNLKNPDLNITKVSPSDLDVWNLQYNKFQNDELLVELCKSKGIDSTYGVMGEAAPWLSEDGLQILAEGGAGQLNTPVSGNVLEKFGIFKEG